MHLIQKFLTAGLLAACLVLAGCGGKPYDYKPSNDLKPGPGLFSGEDGEFTIIGAEPDKKEKSEEREKEAE
jgi:hypothetical protein